jgi:glycosyltransferase involved in cell wall biosynthesis
MTVRYGFVSTYSPTQCGLATFTASLYTALVTNGTGDGRVISVVETPQPSPGPEVVGEMVTGDLNSVLRAADLLNGGDVAIIQHEYGIYGGPDGAEILALLDAIRVPRIVVLHTVLSAPTRRQRTVLEGVLARAETIVTMSDAARDRLIEGYSLSAHKVRVIPHGAPDLDISIGALARSVRPTVLTWGLLGPGKGVEWGIAAMSSLADLDPKPRYVIAGQTHPKVLIYEGEVYRDRLTAQIQRLGLNDSVTFDGRYRDSDSLARLVQSADVVLLPYDSTDQVTSGVLIEAVAALKPVVATRFPHAVELLSGGAGALVDHRDSGGMATALRMVLTSKDVATNMIRVAAQTAPALRWSAVADRYQELAASLLMTSLVR